VFANRTAFEAMPAPMQEVLEGAVAAATVHQREFAVAEEEIARQVILDEGCEIAALTAAEQELFADAVAPLHREARDTFGAEMFALLQEG